MSGSRGARSSLESYEELSARIAAMKSKRLVVVVACVGSALTFCGIFIGLGFMDILKPPVLAYGIGALVLIMDIVAAVIIFVTQGRAIERLRADIVSQFPGMPNAS